MILINFHDLVLKLPFEKMKRVTYLYNVDIILIYLLFTYL